MVALLFVLSVPRRPAIRENMATKSSTSSSPSVAARVVGNLLVDEADRQRRPHIDVARFAEAVAGQALTCRFESTNGGRIRLRARLEAGDRALEQHWYRATSLIQKSTTRRIPSESTTWESPGASEGYGSLMQSANSVAPVANIAS